MDQIINSHSNNLNNLYRDLNTKLRAIIKEVLESPDTSFSNSVKQQDRVIKLCQRQSIKGLVWSRRAMKDVVIKTQEKLDKDLLDFNLLVKREVDRSKIEQKIHDAYLNLARINLMIAQNALYELNQIALNTTFNLPLPTLDEVMNKMIKIKRKK